MHVTTRIHSRPQPPNKTLKENIQRFTYLLIQASHTDPIAVTCQVTIILIIKHLFNEEI